MTGKRLAFDSSEYQRRLSGVRSRMAESELDCLLVTTPENVTYLTGYHTPGYYFYQCLIVTHAAPPVLVLRKLELANVEFFAWIDETVTYEDHEDPVAATAGALGDLGLAAERIGAELDSWFLTVRDHRRLASLIAAELVDAGGTVESVRLTKSPAEIERIRRSCRVAETGIRRGIDAVRTGATENDVAAAVHEGVILAGGEYPGLPPFILSGPRTLIPHGTWGGRTLAAGDPVYFEVAGTTDRYTGARMHSVVVGPADDRHRRLAEASIAGVRAAVDAMAPGIAARDVDRAARGTIAAHGFGPERYRHRLGYSIGIAYPPDWGEGHIMSLRQGEERLLEPGMVFHLPVVLFDDGFGLGFSHSVLITDTGCEPLTEMALELTALDV
jgi:Xaa-Pro dipeptidase